MANPYEAPMTETTLPELPNTDDIVRRLIDGTDIEILAFYDVSDCQIYGRKHRRRLSGTLAAEAESAGCAPTAYQTVLWFCLVYMPVWPLGTYFVMPFAEHDGFDDDAERYRGIRVNCDASQISFHYAIMLTPLLVAGIYVWLWWR